MLKVILVALLISSSAVAETVSLPEPAITSVAPGAFCFQQEPLNEATTPWAHQVLVGWIDDTHVAVYVHGSLPCGSRYSRGIRYYPYSGVLTWTVTFNATTGALNEIGMPTYTPQAAAPAPTNNYNSLSYEIQMVTECNPSAGCGYTSFYPTLVTP